MNHFENRWMYECMSVSRVCCWSLCSSSSFASSFTFLFYFLCARPPFLSINIRGIAGAFCRVSRGIAGYPGVSRGISWYLASIPNNVTHALSALQNFCCLVGFLKFFQTGAQKHTTETILRGASFWPKLTLYKIKRGSEVPTAWSAQSTFRILLDSVL